MHLIVRNARIVTPLPKGPRTGLRGAAMDELSITDLADVSIKSGLIESIKPVRADAKPRKPHAGAVEIDARGHALVPGLVDCHTHACYAGERLGEWDDKRRGVPYLDILKRGGGIMSTVRAVRHAPTDQLVDLLLDRLHAMLQNGSTTIEVKSGYGLNTADELKMLRAIKLAASVFPGTIVPTALLGHAIDDEQPGFVGKTVRETLPAIASEFPGIAVDAFCEQGAWSLEQCVLLFDRARQLGMQIRVHADQFNALGMTPAAIRLEAKSVDHLEATTKEDLALLAASSTFGVMLPACGFHLDGRYGRARKFVQDNGRLCLATNHNPGSAPCKSLCEIMAIAVRHQGLSPAEALNAVTINPAVLLGFADRGTIAEGARADLVLLASADYRSLAFEFGSPPIDVVIANGQIVADRRRRAASTPAKASTDAAPGVGIN